MLRPLTPITASSVLWIATVLPRTASAADWTPLVQLSSSSGTATTNEHGIAADGTTLHVLLAGSNTIRYRRSGDNGLTWSDPKTIASPGASTSVPNITRSGSILHAIWADTRNGNNDAFTQRSLDGGATWKAEMALTNGKRVNRLAAEAWGSSVHFVYNDATGDVFYRHSTDDGASWDATVNLTNSAINDGRPSIAVHQTTVHVTWEDDDGNGFYRTHYLRSIDNGATWSSDLVISGTTWAFRPAIAASPETGAVYLATSERSDASNADTAEIFLWISTDDGKTWSTARRITTLAGSSEHVSISASAESVVMAWEDGVNGSGACCWSAYYAGSIDGGTTWSTPEPVPGTGAGWLGFNVAATPNYAHVLVTSSWTGPDVYYARKTTQDPGIGGAPSTGGATGGGGVSGAGGAMSNSGATNNGGANTGGVTSTGGAISAGGTTGTGGAVNDGGTGNANASGGTAGRTGSEADAGPGSTADGGGCGCRVEAGSSRAPAWLWLGLLACAAPAMRRRRRGN